MRKLINICFVALSLLCGSAFAEFKPYYYSFTYTGFEEGPNRIFRSYISLRGAFDADDLNNNGTFELNELTHFWTKWGDLVNCNQQVITCTINRFSYTPYGALDFDITLTRTTAYHSYILIWQSNGLFLDKNVDAESAYGYYNWTPQTKLSVYAVPEPLSVSMLVAGLGFVGLRARRVAGRAGA